ncbi:hypothetical protein T11_13085 [Trichinella zimbabwensis]|uniref:Uncharacterized protein n=1 Tax=Trichinella zimbabwensis TaxID=268475 RepID=A0A0V1GJG4_9BILA|nr:hypothetical protein T11_13085 [Trichinella zimbabwensis]
MKYLCEVKESDSPSNNFHLLHPATFPSFLPTLLPRPAFPSNDPHHRALNDSKMNRDHAQLKIFATP